jgi:hypothetical protein
MQFLVWSRRARSEHDDAQGQKKGQVRPRTDNANWAPRRSKIHHVEGDKCRAEFQVSDRNTYLISCSLFSLALLTGDMTRYDIACSTQGCAAL